jgi:lipoprotein-anchoring transpeptidase ErfK/SrfK
MTSRTARRVQSRQQRLRVIAGGSALLVVVVATVVLATGGNEKPKARAAPASTTTTAADGAFTPATTLTTAVDELKVYESASEDAKVITNLSELTRYGVERTLLMTATVPGWYEALLPIRPNGTKGWVRAADVTTSTSDFALQVSLTKHQIVLFEKGKRILESSVVIGRPETPTPPGEYYVTDPVDLSTRRGSDYGAFALGISGFSEVLLEFEDGPGQLAIHGTPHPEQVGQDLSNGCVRVPDDVILKIAELVPLGTPVTITA